MVNILFGASLYIFPLINKLWIYIKKLNLKNSCLSLVESNSRAQPRTTDSESQGGDDGRKGDLKRILSKFKKTEPKNAYIHMSNAGCREIIILGKHENLMKLFT